MTNFEVYFRDKELRSEQNRRAYRKRVGQHLRKGTIHQSPPPTRRGLDPHTSSVPVLPPALITHATMHLPTSAMFLEAAQSADALDELELPSWEEDPHTMLSLIQHQKKKDSLAIWLMSCLGDIPGYQTK